MWQQPIPLQQGQYPSYAYNNNIPLQQQAPPQLPPPQQQQQSYSQYNNQSPSPIGNGTHPEAAAAATTIESTFKRQSDGPILWFAGPPLNVLPSTTGPVHSLSYLDWKQQQQRNNK